MGEFFTFPSQLFTQVNSSLETLWGVTSSHNAQMFQSASDLPQPIDLSDTLKARRYNFFTGKNRELYFIKTGKISTLIDNTNSHTVPRARTGSCFLPPEEVFNSQEVPLSAETSL